MSAEEVFTGIEAMVDSFRRLGLMWRLVKGTVFTGPNTPTLTLVTLDGDTEPSNTISMVGAVASGTRVYVMVVPPQGNYIVGLVTVGSTLNENGVGATAASDTTTSGAFANLTGTSSFTFTKGSSGTRLKVTMHASCFTGAINTRPEFAVLINGVDYLIVSMLLNPASTHLMLSGHSYIPSIAAGTFTIQGRWRRAAGAGTLTRGPNDDWLSISAKELP